MVIIVVLVEPVIGSMGMLYLNKPVTVPQCMTAFASKYYIEEHFKRVHTCRRVRLPRVGTEKQVTAPARSEHHKDRTPCPDAEKYSWGF
jgi:hypothetical protein